MNLAIDGVRADIEGENLERVGVHEERVLLRVVNRDGPFGGHRIACGVVVLTVVARHHILVDGIVIHHIPIGIVGAVAGVVIDAVAYQLLTLVVQHRAVHQPRPVELCVVVPLFRVDMAFTRQDV